MKIKQMYESLGNNKSQRFWRFFLLSSVVAAVLIIGFYTDAINFVFSIGKEVAK